MTGQSADVRTQTTIETRMTDQLPKAVIRGRAKGAVEAQVEVLAVSVAVVPKLHQGEELELPLVTPSRSRKSL